MRRTELHTKATRLASLDDDRNTSFCHLSPQLGATMTPKFNCGGCDYGGNEVSQSVMAVTERREVKHDALGDH